MCRCLLMLVLSLPLAAADWPGFRGSNASGVAVDDSAPVEFGLERNLVWSAEVPKGASSPVVGGGRVYLTTFDGSELALLCWDAADGKLRWRRTAPRPRQGKYHPQHGPATPSPAFDGENVYAFFPDFGLLSFTPDGAERWRRPLGPFSSVQGLASSPLVADGLVVVLIDQTVDAHIAAFSADTGQEVWRQARPTNFLGSYSTPIVHRPAGGPAEVIAAGAVELTAYQLRTGERLWWSTGWMAPVSAPVLGSDQVYASEPLNQSPPPFSSVASLDRDKDGRFTREEAAGASGLIYLIDRIDAEEGDGDGAIDEAEWNRAFEEFEGAGGLKAIRLGAAGEVSAADTTWRYTKSLPYLSSILLYQDVLYAVRDGGIVTALDAATGAVLKQGRLREALGGYYASPVAADGKIYFANMEGMVSVVRAGKDWEVLAVNDLGAPIQASPAISGGRLYVRTHKALYCFGSDS